MADTVKISELPVATTISGSDTLLLVQGGITKQITESNANSAAAILAKLLTVDGSTCGLYAQYAGQVPDYGIGLGSAPAMASDWDNYKTTGIFRDSSLLSHNPGGGSPIAAMCLVLAYSSSYVIQAAYGIDLSPPPLFVREYKAGVWGPWAKIFTSLTDGNGGQPPAPKSNTSGSSGSYTQGRELGGVVAAGQPLYFSGATNETGTWRMYYFQRTIGVAGSAGVYLGSGQITASLAIDTVYHTVRVS